MYLRNEYWYYDFIVDGERYRGSTGFKKNEKSKAVNAVTKLKMQVREKHSIDMMWEQVKRQKIACNELELDFDTIWTAYEKKNFRQISIKRTKNKIGKIRTFCKWIKDNYPEVKKVSQVTSIHASDWMNSIYAGVGANDTKNDYLTNLKSVFNMLGKDYGIVENPFDSVNKLPKNKVTRDIFTSEELELICNNATGWIYSLCLTAMSTGLREGDICLLKKECVNLKKQWILTDTNKTGVYVEIPIMPKLLMHLKECIEDDDNDSEYVFPQLAKKYQDNPGDIGSDVKDFFEKIGITNHIKVVAGYKRKISTKDIHSFRHTFVYLAAENGIPFPIVQGIVGHTSPEMTKHYMDHAGREAKQKYLQQLPTFLTGQKKNAPKKITKERLLHLLDKITKDNFDKNKKRIMAIVEQIS